MPNQPLNDEWQATLVRRFQKLFSLSTAIRYAREVRDFLLENHGELISELALSTYLEKLIHSSTSKAQFFLAGWNSYAQSLIDDGIKIDKIVQNYATRGKKPEAAAQLIDGLPAEVAGLRAPLAKFCDALSLDPIHLRKARLQGVHTSPAFDARTMEHYQMTMLFPKDSKIVNKKKEFIGWRSDGKDGIKVLLTDLVKWSNPEPRTMQPLDYFVPKSPEQRQKPMNAELLQAVYASGVKLNKSTHLTLVPAVPQENRSAASLGASGSGSGSGSNNLSAGVAPGVGSPMMGEDGF